MFTKKQINYKIVILFLLMLLMFSMKINHFDVIAERLVDDAPDEIKSEKILLLPSNENPYLDDAGTIPRAVKPNLSFDDFDKYRGKSIYNDYLYRTDYGKGFLDQTVPIYMWMNDELKDVSSRNLNYYLILENRQRTFAGDSTDTHFVNKALSLNLKEPFGGGEGFAKTIINDAKTVINASDSGKYKTIAEVNVTGTYEWRYIGYSKGMYPINNPVFPQDYGTKKPASDYITKNLIVESWYNMAGVGVSDFQLKLEKRPELAQEIYNDYFKPKYPEYHTYATKTMGYEDWRAWKYWFDRFQWLTDPRASKGIVKGWHTYYDKNRDQQWRYYTLSTSSPNIDNVILKEIEISEKHPENILE